MLILKYRDDESLSLAVSCSLIYLCPSSTQLFEILCLPAEDSAFAKAASAIFLYLPAKSVRLVKFLFIIYKIIKSVVYAFSSLLIYFSSSSSSFGSMPISSYTNFFSMYVNKYKNSCTLAIFVIPPLPHPRFSFYYYLCCYCFLLHILLHEPQQQQTHVFDVILSHKQFSNNLALNYHLI
uniref:Uncharacterized protein n=1 Tax=Glossina palpalis gambiensis TaxID=67801 RepID=A0A1B0BWE3_9MUSC